MSGQTPATGSRSLTEQLADRLAQPVDAATRARSRLHLLDWLGCVAGARASALFPLVVRAEPDVPSRAALLGNLLEMDDVDRQGRLHPGPVVWPAALSAAREEGSTMAALLDGAVRGYEAMVRIGRSLDDHHYAHWHPTATAGGFGAAAAAASVFGLAADRTVWALGHSGSLAGGLWQLRHEPAAMTKAVHAAQAALSGLWHARLARQGIAGPRFILEGPQGLFAAATRAPRPEAITCAGGWRLPEISLKPWGACRHAHPAIDAALALPPGALAAGPIRIETYADALTFCDRPAPETVGQAKFSLQHAIAVVAVRGKPTLADFELDAVNDPALAAVRSRVCVDGDRLFDAAYPAHFGARVAAGGTSAEVADAWGDPERPLDRAGIETKFRTLAAWGGLPPGEADVALALVLESPEDSAAVAIVDLLARWLA